jgi:predicted nucleic acid-binding protein
VILVDTSIWIDRLRLSNPALASLLQNAAICIHGVMIGELACGSLRNRAEVIGLLQSLPRLARATEDETLFFIEQQDLMGCGIGYVDADLLAAAVIRGVPVWTKDKRLMTVAEEKGWVYSPGH